MIETSRILLLPFTPALYRHLLARDRGGAQQELGYTLDSEPDLPDWLLEMRLRELEHDPSLQPWLLHAVIDRATAHMVGHIGFHTKPGPAYLQEVSPGGVEMGYTIEPPYRRRGFARASVLALMGWAQREHGVQRFVASVSPGNLASVNLVRGLGFRVVAGHDDELDGYEDIYERVGRVPPAE